MREIRPSGSEGGEAETNRPSLPLSQPRASEATPWVRRANSKIDPERVGHSPTLSGWIGELDARTQGVASLALG